GPQPIQPQARSHLPLLRRGLHGAGHHPLLQQDPHAPGEPPLRGRRPDHDRTGTDGGILPAAQEGAGHGMLGGGRLPRLNGTSRDRDLVGSLRLVEFVREHVPAGDDDGEEFAGGGGAVRGRGRRRRGGRRRTEEGVEVRRREILRRGRLRTGIPPRRTVL
ncbi:hypothetical protein ACHAWF_010070, partial [Thalassiosira exigua]